MSDAATNTRAPKQENAEESAVIEENNEGYGDSDSDGDGDGDGVLDFWPSLPSPLPSSSSDEEYYSDSDYSDSDYSSDEGGPSDDSSSEPEKDDNSPETNFRMLAEALDSRSVQKRAEAEDLMCKYDEDIFDFPKDPERWTEEDLMELWAEPPFWPNPRSTRPGWDPVWANKYDWEDVEMEIEDRRDPPIAPFYLPYRKPYPVIPDNHFDISNAKSVIEELDRIEEFLKWGSYIFRNGSSYEGTIWDDLANGKGVYISKQGLVRYEGEWLQNAMEGHGVVEVEIPGVEPVPGSKLEAKMRAEGRIIKRDFMTPRDKKWLEMDIKDTMHLVGHVKETPFYEKDEWVELFGKKPEKGRYRYAGQWKHGRMHGCGVYEVNDHIIYGRFYFGEHLDDSTGCDSDISALHAGIAEVAAAKARMFVNKPDGMVRQKRGPYGDPQHPYFYEEEDTWMAPGFVSQFYEVPNYWKTYAEEIDQEREMWLNSFYKAPLRIPMPAELEYWWSKDENPEFLLFNKEPEPDPEDPSKLIYTDDPLIFHTRTGRLINYVEDEKHGVRLFWQPRPKHKDEDPNGDEDEDEDEDEDDLDEAPDEVEFLPLGFDEFYGRGNKPRAVKESTLTRLMNSVEKALKPLLDKLERWTEEKKKASEVNLELFEQELEFIEAEICLEEALEDMETELKMKQKEEEKRSADEKEEGIPVEAEGYEADSEASEDEDEDEDEEEDGAAPPSFGTVRPVETDTKSVEEGKKSPFSSLSMSLASWSPVTVVPSKLQEAFLSWKGSRKLPASNQNLERSPDYPRGLDSVKFPCLSSRANLRAVQERQCLCKRTTNTGQSQMNSLARVLSTCEPRWSSKPRGSVGDYKNLSILSLHVPLTDTITL